MQSDCSHKSEDVDVVVVGAGPGGITAATHLAKAGRTVKLIERQSFPRFHIGESLLPYMAGLLDKFGLLDQIREQGYVVKRGAEFTGTDGDFHRIEFTAQGQGRHYETFQVERAHFDNVLLQNAKDAGVEVVTNTPVTELVMADERVVGVVCNQNGDRTVARARYVIDAAGRASKTAIQFQLRQQIEQLRMVAVYRHFTGLNEKNNPGHEGDIQIGNHDDGWLWAIPIWSDTISVGVVMPKQKLRDSKPEEAFAQYLGKIPRIDERLRGTRPLGDVRVETDYSYYSDQVAGEGWLMVGDSGCFVDPLFSGGVYLAMVTGAKAAEIAHEALDDPSRASELQDSYANFYKTGYDTYARLIQAYYECDLDFGRYVRSLPESIEIHWMARLLSGDFWSGDNPLNRLLRAERRWDVFAPFEPMYGCPVYPADAEDIRDAARSG